MVVTTPLRPVTKIIFSLLYSLKSQNSLRSDSWLFKLFLAVGKKLFFLRHRANAPLSPPSLPCREVTVVLSGSRQRNYFTVKVKRFAYGNSSSPCPGYLVVASHPTQPRSNLKWKLVKVSWCREGIMVGGKRILEVRCGGGWQ